MVSDGQRKLHFQHASLSVADLSREDVRQPAREIRMRGVMTGSISSVLNFRLWARRHVRPGGGGRGGAGFTKTCTLGWSDTQARSCD